MGSDMSKFTYKLAAEPRVTNSQSITTGSCYLMICLCPFYEQLGFQSQVFKSTNIFYELEDKSK